MLATPGPLPTGPEWAFEVKFDGIRLLADTRSGRTRLWSRNGRDLTRAFPELAALRRATPGGAVLDGELIAGNARPPTLQALAPRINRTTADASLQRTCPVVYMVFDVLEVQGRDMTDRPFDERHALLTDLLDDSATWHVSDVFDDGAALWEATASAGMEGVVSKRRTSVYRPGVRSPDWIKTVHRSATDVVIIGWRPEAGGRQRVGSLTVAVPSPGGLQYAGSVGSGLTGHLSEALLAVLPSIARTDPPVGLPDGVDPSIRWVDPVLVAAVDHLGTTRDGRLRQAAISALRPDVTVADLADDQPTDFPRTGPA